MSKRNRNGDILESRPDGQTSMATSLHEQDDAGAQDVQAHARHGAGIRASWERFVDSGLLARTPGLPDAVAGSWERCLKGGVDHLSAVGGDGYRDTTPRIEDAAAGLPRCALGFSGSTSRTFTISLT